MATRPSVYITRRIPQRGVDILLQDCDVKHWDSEQTAPRGELIHCVVGAEAILCMPGDVIDAHVMKAAGPQLKVIATISESTDHIDYNECESRGIRVITCPLQSAQNLADLTVALVLLTIKNSVTDEERKTLCKSLSISHDADFENGCLAQNAMKSISNRPLLMRQMSEEQMAFQYSNGKPVNTNCLTWRTIAQKTFGIYGLSQTGANVVKLLKNLGISNVLAADVGAGKLSNSNGTSDESNVFESGGSLKEGNFDIVSFDQLLSRCDIICVCGSVGPESDSIFSQESFRKMKTDAILITSQSEELAVDYIALYEALRDGHIKAAGLNDCNQVDCPLKTMFQGLKNCVFLPQTLESVYDTRHQASVLVAKNLICAIKSNRLSTMSNGHDH